MELKIFGKVITIKNQIQPFPKTGDDTGWQNYLAGKGYTVNSETALKVSAVFRCVDVIAKTMASLPLHLFEETQRGKERARNHPLYRILYVLPNKDTTAYHFWHMYLVNLLLTTGAFAKIERNRAGTITGLRNIPTCRVSSVFVNRINGERYIYVTDDEGHIETLRDGDFMYTPSLRFSSDKDPNDPISMASEVLGLTMDLNGYAKTAFEEGINPGGFLEYPNHLSDEAYERMKSDFTENYAGVQKNHRWILLEEGAKASPFSRDLEKSQALESRKFAVVEVCRMFGVPPHLVYDLERATFSNIEQQSIEFVQNCVTPMAVQLEQTIYKDLLTQSEQKKYFAKFNVNALMRGDTAARTAYYNSARQNGWMNGDEIRELEDMNRMPDEIGSLYTVNGNMIPLSAVPQNLPKGAAKGALK